MARTMKGYEHDNNQDPETSGKNDPIELKWTNESEGRPHGDFFGGQSEPIDGESTNIFNRERKTSELLWDEKMDQLREYKRVHGHTNVPKNSKYKQLGRFVNNQRQLYRKRLMKEKNSLTEERIKALEELGFVWSMKPISEDRARGLQEQWESRLQELREFKEVHGHCNVPLKGNKVLAKFVMNQRYYYKTRLEGQTNSLTPQRIQDLENVGFVWTLKGRREEGGGGKFLSNEDKWRRNVKELKKFKEKFGHVNVKKTGDYTELGQFVGNQRYHYRRRLKGESSSLTDDRMKTLSDLGFEWKAQRGGASNEAHASSKMEGGAQVTESGKVVSLPDGSTVRCSRKQSSHKRLVLLEDGSEMLEIVTETRSTKVERSVIPAEEDVEDVNADSGTGTKPPSFPSDMNVFDFENSFRCPDGSKIERTAKETSEKRMVESLDGNLLLETTTTTCSTKIEQIRLPGEVMEMSTADGPVGV